MGGPAPPCHDSPVKESVYASRYAYTKLDIYVVFVSFRYFVAVLVGFYPLIDTVFIHSTLDLK